MKSSYTSHLIPEIANSHPLTTKLLQMRKRFLLPLPLTLSLHQPISIRTTHHTPQFPHQNLSPKSGQNLYHNRSQKTPSYQRHRSHQHLR